MPEALFTLRCVQAASVPYQLGDTSNVFPFNHSRAHARIARYVVRAVHLAMVRKCARQRSFRGDRRAPRGPAGRRALPQNLLPKQALAEIHNIAHKARNDHDFLTLPWDDKGYRILPAAIYMEHTEKMRHYCKQFTAAINDFGRRFEELVRESRERLGGLFRAEDYPSPLEIQQKFSFETRVIPLPNANDFRVTLADEDKDRIKRQITASVEAAFAAGSRELWQRMYEAVSHMAERLATYKSEDGVKHRLHDSLVTNLVKLLDVMPKLNVIHDPDLDRLSAEIRSSLVVDPDTLRKSESVRVETARAAARIADQMASYMAGYQLAMVA